MKKRAILIMTYGSPNDYSFEGIADFFTNIRRGKRPKEEEIFLRSSIDLLINSLLLVIIRII